MNSCKRTFAIDDNILWILKYLRLEIYSGLT